MSNKYEDLIKNARMNADCGEHMSPAEVTSLLNVVETTFAALAAENAGLKEWSPNPHSASMFEAIEKAEELMDDGMPELAMIEAFEILKMKRTPATDAFLAEVRAQGVGSLSNAVQSVIAERQRQQSAEGWTPEHDDQYSKSQLLWASSCYVLNTIQPFNRIPLDWPWAPEWWKPTNPRRDLVKAGALILAEIERIDRQEAAQ